MEARSENANRFLGKRVLLVDDDPDFVAQERTLLELIGFEVQTAASAKEAELLLVDKMPDLAIVDLMMEHPDAGFALCHHIKHMSKPGKEIPVILVSGVAAKTGLEFDAATEEERSWVKADAMLAKPLRFDQLSREISRLLNGTRHSAPVARAARP
jgi:CheY-like chemotaxis protein